MRTQSFVASCSFPECFKLLIAPGKLEKAWRHCVSGRGAPPTLGAVEFVMALVYHCFCRSGTLAQHAARLNKIKISDSAFSQRRQNVPFEFFEKLLAMALRPFAAEEKQPEAFYRGLRLTAFDGTQFSISNTPQALAGLSKAASRRFQAAFAKIGVCVLVELGLHNPLALAIGHMQESELSLAGRLLAAIVPRSLLLADRLFGTGATLSEIGQACTAKESHFLVRVRRQLKARALEIFNDGSALMEVHLHDKKHFRLCIGKILVREIRGRVHKPGQGWSEVRIWTSLLDAKTYPATELFALYARRWEQELYYKELKIDLRSSELLQSHTPETAAQEIAALILASAIVARQRAVVAGQAEVEVSRISFRKTRELFDSLFIVLEAGKEVLTPSQAQQLVERTIALIAREALLPKRRSRSCPRAVRQPIKGWPRLAKNSSVEGDLTSEIILISI